MARGYYMLIASLPALPRFDRAARLPINPVRLRERLHMLEPNEETLIEQLADFLEWQRQPVERTDAEVVAYFKKAGAWISQRPAIQQIVELVMHQRTVMAALRRRHRGLPAPSPDQQWGVEILVRSILRNWEDPNFKLLGQYPWLLKAREHLENGNAVALEKLLSELIWNGADRIVQEDPFTFDALVAYLIKWDVLRNWVVHDRQAAAEHFKELVSEVTNEYEKLFE